MPRPVRVAEKPSLTALGGLAERLLDSIERFKAQFAGNACAIDTVIAQIRIFFGHGDFNPRKLPLPSSTKTAFLVVFADDVEHPPLGLIHEDLRISSIARAASAMWRNGRQASGEKISIVSPRAHFFAISLTRRSNRMRPDSPQIVPKRSSAQAGGGAGGQHHSRIQP